MSPCPLSVATIDLIGPWILAYIDPGSGSYALQLLLAALAAVVVATRRSWGWLAILFVSPFRRRPRASRKD